jgi:hypothetical protein
MTYMYDMPNEIRVEAGDLTSFGTDDFRTTITQLTEKLTEEKKS